MALTPCERATESFDGPSQFRLIFALRNSSLPVVIPGGVPIGMRWILHIAAWGALALASASDPKAHASGDYAEERSIRGGSDS